MIGKAFLLFIILLSLLLILLGEFQLFELGEPENYKYMRVSGYLLQVLFWILFWYKQARSQNEKI